MSAGTRPNRRCLIVERHLWETGGAQQQLQIPLDVARRFFGAQRRTVTMTLYSRPAAGRPLLQRTATTGPIYAASRTFRINGLPEMSLIPPGFVFFEETGPASFDVWW